MDPLQRRIAFVLVELWTAIAVEQFAAPVLIIVWITIFWSRAWVVVSKREKKKFVGKNAQYQIYRTNSQAWMILTAQSIGNLVHAVEPMPAHFVGQTCTESMGDYISRLVQWTMERRSERYLYNDGANSPANAWALRITKSEQEFHGLCTIHTLSVPDLCVSYANTLGIFLDAWQCMRLI